MASLVRHLIGDLAAWNARRRTNAAVHALDHHLLADIGVSRSDIVAAVNGFVTDR